jgi:hypothetical protein
MDVDRYIQQCTETVSKDEVTATFQAIQQAENDGSNWATVAAIDPVLIAEPTNTLGSMSKTDITNGQSQDKAIQRLLELMKSKQPPSTKCRQRESYEVQVL